MNNNLTELLKGNKYRLELFAANMSRAGAEFARTRSAAVKRRKDLKAAGYVVTIFTITDSGGLML